jgi:hypothetical protein
LGCSNRDVENKMDISKNKIIHIIENDEIKVNISH